MTQGQFKKDWAVMVQKRFEGATKKDAVGLLEDLVGYIAKNSKKAEKVNIPGLGIFTVRSRPARGAGTRRPVRRSRSRRPRRSPSVPPRPSRRPPAPRRSPPPLPSSASVASRLERGPRVRPRAPFFFPSPS